jgi:dynein assembly factor 3
MYWGYTPAINCFANVDFVDPTKDDKPINVLISEGSGDMRHLLKSLSDILPNIKEPRRHPINLYIHDTSKPNLARHVLLLTLLCETGMSSRERMEMFLDIFANSMIRDKT